MGADFNQGWQSLLGMVLLEKVKKKKVKEKLIRKESKTQGTLQFRLRAIQVMSRRQYSLQAINSKL